MKEVTAQEKQVFEVQSEESEENIQEVIWKLNQDAKKTLDS